MENIISNSDKTNEDLQIEEYDKTDAVDTTDLDLSEDGDTHGKKSIKDVILKQLPFLAKLINGKKKNNKEEISEKGSKSSSGREKFKLTPIHIIVIVGLLVFLFIDEEEEIAETPPLNKIQKVAPSENIESNVEDSTSDIESELTPTEDQNLEPEETTNGDLEDLKISDDSLTVEEPINDTGDRDELDVTDEGATELENLDLGIDRSTVPQRSNENEPDPSEENANVESNIDTNTNSIEDNNPVEDTSIPEEITPQEIIVPDASNDITRKLLENLEVKLKEERGILESTESIKPTSAPSYEAPGSGLVYNCSGGHWACVDVEEYKKCRDNHAWKKSESQEIECYPSGFFKKDSDCATVQQEKINAVSDLGFCRIN